MAAPASPEPLKPDLYRRWGIREDVSEAEAQEIICRIFGISQVNPK